MNLLRGAFDLHVHAAPDDVTRSVDDAALAIEASTAGMRGFVLKSHGEPTVSRAVLLGAAHPGLVVGGSVTLNRSVGGLNPEAVLWAARVAKGGPRPIVWLPTKDAAHDRQVKGKPAEGGLALLDGDGLSREALAVCEAAAERDLILATGHVSPREGLAMIAAAAEMGARHLVVTHATAPVSGYDEGEMRSAAALGALIEFSALNYTEPTARAGGRSGAKNAALTIAGLAALIRRLGAANCLLSSDLGNVNMPKPVAGFATFIEALAEAGLSGDEIQTMVVQNPARLLLEGRERS